MILKDFSNCLEVDKEKKRLVNDILFPELKIKLEEPSFYKMHELIDDYCEEDSVAYKSRRSRRPTKYCPECYREYPERENVCMDCLVGLKNISDIVPVRQIESHPEFPVEGKNRFNSLEEILTDENLAKIDEFRFNIRQYRTIIRNIKKTALLNFDELIKTNEINMKRLTTLDKVLLFAKAFVNVEYKSHGQELGYFEFNRITIDERQTDPLQVTTLIHELSHFLIKEILAEILCKLLKCAKNDHIENIITFILSYSNFTQLIDEYSAHTVEGRFTVYGYQDYSSFLSIIERIGDEMTKEEIEITKSIGNTFAISIKDILESFIDFDLRRDIKDDFLATNFDRPNYEMLRLENCDRLTDEGFIRAIWLILFDGFRACQMNIENIE
jgi:hypothetical protein